MYVHVLPSSVYLFSNVDFKYIDEEGTVQLKGCVACEIHTHEIIITELLFRNKLEGFEAAEVAALLSCMVFQQVEMMNNLNHSTCTHILILSCTWAEKSEIIYYYIV